MQARTATSAAAEAAITAAWQEALEGGRRLLIEGKLPGPLFIILAARLGGGDPISPGIGSLLVSESDVREMLFQIEEVIKWTRVADVVGATSGPLAEARLGLLAALTIQQLLLSDPKYQGLVMSCSALNQERTLLESRDSTGNIVPAGSCDITKPPQDQQDLVAKLRSAISSESVIAMVKKNNARLGGRVGSRDEAKPPIREGAGGWCLGTRGGTRELGTGKFEQLLVEKMARDPNRFEGQIYTARDIKVMDDMLGAQIDILGVQGNPEGKPLPHPVEFWQSYMKEEATHNGCNPEDVDLLHELFDSVATYEAQDCERGAPTHLL